MAWLVAFQSSSHPTWVCPHALSQQPISPTVALIKDCDLHQPWSPAWVTTTFWPVVFFLLDLKGTIRKGNKAAEMQASTFVSNALGRIRPTCLTPAA